MKENKKQVSIIVPAYNEESKIGEVLESLTSNGDLNGIDKEVIVVDDGSTDKTAEIAKKYNIKIVSHQKNRGYGASLKTGIRSAKNDIIVIADADGTYPVDRIFEMINLIDDYDMVVGARTEANAEIPWIRKPAKWILNKYANYLVREDIPDLNSGLRVFKKNVYREFINILPDGFSFTTTITLAMLTNNYLVKYLPIRYYKRGGKSKIRPIRDTINFFSLITRTSLYFKPLRVFVPITVLFLILGGSFLIYDVFFIQNLTEKTLITFLWVMQFGMLGLLADMIVHKK